MSDIKQVIKKRILFFVSNIVIVFAFIINFLHSNILPVVMEYGKYQCKNIMTKLVNTVVEKNIAENLKEKIVVYNDSEIISIDFNTAILNSISSNAIKQLQIYLYRLEQGMLEEYFLEEIGVAVSNSMAKRGIVYEVPLSRALNNSVIGNLGVGVPVKYKMIGEVRGQVVSSIKEYGINNALLEISLQIKFKSMIAIPVLSSEEVIDVSVPLVIKYIQGEIPESFFGSNVIGGIN